MPVNQTQVMTELSYLLGERTVPTSGTEDRKGFINTTLKEIYRAYPWEWAMTTATFSLTSGIASLPSGALVDRPLDVREIVSGSDNDNVYAQVTYQEQDNFNQGDYRYWITGTPDNYQINTKEDNATITVRYQVEAPTLDDAGAVTTPFPSANVVALGALRYIRMGENPQADISQEETLFRNRLEEYMGLARRNNPKRRRSIQSVNNHNTGGI